MCWGTLRTADVVVEGAHACALTNPASRAAAAFRFSRDVSASAAHASRLGCNTAQGSGTRRLHATTFKKPLAGNGKQIAPDAATK